MGYRILMLTDHSGHTANNSAYALGRILASHPDVIKLSAVSRGDERNVPFFTDDLSSSPFARDVDTDFHYDESGSMFFDSYVDKVDIHDYDVIFLRLPPPIPRPFFEKLTRLIPDQNIINRPSGILKTSSKLFLLEVAELCPPIQRIQSRGDLITFSARFPIVLKPLNAYGGKGIVKIEAGSVEADGSVISLDSWIESLDGSIDYLGMKYLKNVDQGDKRTIMVNGQIMGSSLRLPAEGTWLCNVAQGGHAVDATVTPEELKIAERLAEIVVPLGIVILGFDTLVDDNGKRVLSELNTMSVGGFENVLPFQSRNVLKDTADQMMAYIRSHI